MVVLVLGFPGSGKSYFATRLAKVLDADYLNSDRLRKKLFSERFYSKSEKAKIYEVLLKKMQEAIDEEKNLVLDATFHKNQTRKPFITLGKGLISFIEVYANEDVIKERLKKHRPYSDADFSVYQLIKKQWKPLQQPHLTLQSTNDNIESMLQKAIQYLGHDTKTD
jgi:hypothetical protein